jgi:hypothetical protein
MQIAGYDISTLGPLGLPHDEWNIDEKGLSCTRTVLALYAEWQDTVPGLYSPHPFSSAVLFRKARVIQEQEIGDLCLVIMTYDQYYLNVASTPTPQPQFGVNGNTIMQDITLHPNFNGGAGSWDANAPWSQFWDVNLKDWNKASSGPGYDPSVPPYLIGWTKFPDGAATIWTKTFYDSQPVDPLPVGQIVDPGFGFGPSGCYFCGTADRQKENAFWYDLLHFQYYPRGVPTQIFQWGST